MLGFGFSHMAGASGAPPLRLVASGTSLATGTQTISGGATKARIRSRHVIMEDTDTLMFVLPGFYADGVSAEQAIAWTATSLKLQYEVPGASTPLVRATVGGNDTPAPSGPTITLDEIRAAAFGKTNFTAGDVIWLLQEYDFPAINGLLPLTDGTGAASSGVSGEGVYFGGTTSIGESGSLVAHGGTSQPTRMIRPWLVIGRHNGVAVAAIGDSIPFGKNTTNPVNDGSSSGGYPARAAYNAGVALTKMCRSGTRAAHFTADNAPIRLGALQYFTHVWFGLGYNDIAVTGGDDSTATIAAIDSALGLIRGGNPSIGIQLQAITIRTGAGSGTSTATQTVSTGYAAGGASERGIVNAHLAALVGSNGVLGLTDFTSVMADSVATDKWFIDGVPTNNYSTSDGAHPTQAMDGLMVAVAQPVIAGFTA
jgi:hypothetical protein